VKESENARIYPLEEGKDALSIMFCLGGGRKKKKISKYIQV
jgi:hypothetical protein